MKNKCDICGRETNRIHHTYGYTLCSKHMHQYNKYGKFLDNTQRTNNDLNDYRIIGGGIVCFNIYNQKNVKNGEFYIDIDDIEKVKYKKWRLSHGHVVTGLPAKNTQRDLAHVILDFVPKDGYVVDHIDGNPFNNCKSNLRICKQSDNVLNKSFMSNNTSGFIGVSYRENRDRYDPEIRLQNIRCHLGYTKSLEDAVYKRYYAEELVFKGYCSEKEHLKKKEFTKNLSPQKKKELEAIVEKKLIAKNLWQ